ncbi:hypothetical protein EJ357_22600 [Streptomyces cyaneochromogenes]|uniref:Uncharacterized protein n=1 Tax=Streptomyces cyaneochromogenes TaxID=2496836 RepID=A0A3S9M9R5_9ACTN|nr:hypothetical protein [Streptomyces cyaneochromogenes]AZQ35924.1 hypothetical protein EJ357_22600 [Streptomyces cyaneochromogenes]
MSAVFRPRTRQRDAREREIAAYVRQQRGIHGGLGAADVARLARQDGRDYTELEVAHVMSLMSTTLSTPPRRNP